MARRNSHLFCPRRNLKCGGKLSANSTMRWSKWDARAYFQRGRHALMRSTLVRILSTRYVLTSTYCCRVNGISADRQAKWPAIVSSGVLVMVAAKFGRYKARRSAEVKHHPARWCCSDGGNAAPSTNRFAYSSTLLAACGLKRAASSVRRSRITDGTTRS